MRARSRRGSLDDEGIKMLEICVPLKAATTVEKYRKRKFSLLSASATCVNLTI